MKKTTKRISEKIANHIFLFMAIIAVVSVSAITLYMFLKGAPAIIEVGAPNLLFGTVWKPQQSKHILESHISYYHPL